MASFDFVKALDRCKGYGDIFDLVKRAVRKFLGLNRAGLMLYLGNLPIHVGAFYKMGSNAIVMNKKLINMMLKTFRSPTEANSYIFVLLLHEYLHTLGYVEERIVMRLVYEITEASFGPNHPATKMAIHMPMPRIQYSNETLEKESSDLEIVRDFDKVSQTYIS